MRVQYFRACLLACAHPYRMRPISLRAGARVRAAITAHRVEHNSTPPPLASSRRGWW